MPEENNQINLEERVKWIEYEGKNILYVDLSALDEDSILKIYDLYEAEILKMENKKNVPVLFNCTNTTFTYKIMKRVNKSTAKIEKRNLTILVALTGIEGMHKVIAKVIPYKGILYCDSIEDCKKQLIKKAK